MDAKKGRTSVVHEPDDGDYFSSFEYFSHSCAI
jgi:hypothetical protein